MVCTQASQGSVVNISSVAAERPFQGAGAYSVSKAAVNMFTKASALELAPSVRIFSDHGIGTCVQSCVYLNGILVPPP